MMATPKAVYLRPFLEVRLVAELLTVPKRVMVCLICMVFLLLPGYPGHKSRRGAKVRCSQVAAWPRCQVKKFLERDPEPARGRSPKPGGRGTRVLNAEPQGAAKAQSRWPSDPANYRSCRT